MSESENELEKRLPLSPAAFSILLALKDGEKHGYAILQAAADQSNGAVKLLPGTLYNLLKRMLEDGWIEELDERPDPKLDDQRRRYYRLTGLGERIARLEAERLQSLVYAARQHGILGLKGEL
ncbi:MAG TPA: helix-turn-helix transcriptional regulator [Anaerolineales bacterium]|nr:helix-turn-helix transcriptional regulator [Anaerolineales bacterium]